MSENQSPEPIEPPESAPKYIVDGLAKQSPATLDAIADYARELAEAERVQAKDDVDGDDPDEVPDEWDADEWADIVAEKREAADVSASDGTVVDIEIDGRYYYYLKWWDGEKGYVDSKYIAPVTPASSESSD